MATAPLPAVKCLVRRALIPRKLTMVFLLYSRHNCAKFAIYLILRQDSKLKMSTQNTKEQNTKQITGKASSRPHACRAGATILALLTTLAAGLCSGTTAALAQDKSPWQPEEINNQNQPTPEEAGEQSVEFTPLGQAQGTPALNVIVPAARPPLPPPPQVNLPFTAAQPSKPSLAWRARASALFKNSELDARTAAVTVTASLATLRQSLERRIQEAGLTIADEAPDGRQILFVLPFENQNRQDSLQIQRVAPERAILAVKPIKGSTGNFEVRAQIETRNKSLNIERVKQILETVRSENQTQMQTQNQSTDDPML